MHSLLDVLRCWLVSKVYHIVVMWWFTSI